MPNGKPNGKPNGRQLTLTQSQKLDRILRICAASITVVGGIISTVITVVDAERRYRKRDTKRRPKKAKVISVKTLKEKRRRLKKGKGNGKTKEKA